MAAETLSRRAAARSRSRLSREQRRELWRPTEQNAGAGWETGRLRREKETGWKDVDAQQGS